MTTKTPYLDDLDERQEFFTRTHDAAKSEDYRASIRNCIALLEAKREGYLVRAAEEDKVKAALLAAVARALDHVEELEEAWLTGAISERDGLGGARSNRNSDIRVQLQVAIALVEKEQ